MVPGAPGGDRWALGDGGCLEPGGDGPEEGTMVAIVPVACGHGWALVMSSRVSTADSVTRPPWSWLVKALLCVGTEAQ